MDNLKNEIKQFLIDNNYEERRCSPSMDLKELELVSSLISNIINSKEVEISTFDYNRFNQEEYVDMAYYKPIEDFLIKNNFYKKVGSLECNSCKNNYFDESIEFKDLNFKNIKKCHHCEFKIDFYRKDNYLFGQKIAYIDSLDFISKLVKIN